MGTEDSNYHDEGSIKTAAPAVGDGLVTPGQANSMTNLGA